MNVLTEKEKLAALENLRERLKSMGFREVENVHGFMRIVLPGFNISYDESEEPEED